MIHAAPRRARAAPRPRVSRPARARVAWIEQPFNIPQQYINVKYLPTTNIQ